MNATARPAAPMRNTIRTSYTPTPMTAEERTQIARALETPKATKPLGAYEMSPKTHALLQVLMTVSATVRGAQNAAAR